MCTLSRHLSSLGYRGIPRRRALGRQQEGVGETQASAAVLASLQVIAACSSKPPCTCTCTCSRPTFPFPCSIRHAHIGPPTSHRTSMDADADADLAYIHIFGYSVEEALKLRDTQGSNEEPMGRPAHTREGRTMHCRCHADAFCMRTLPRQTCHPSVFS